MREIRFRVWDSELKFFSNAYDIYCANGSISGGVMVYPEGGRFIAQQYTGAKDINGKEIYEGDLVKTRKEHEAWILGSILGEPIGDYERGKIKFICSAWKVCDSKIGASYLNKYCCCDEHGAALEIVGNIFETHD